jgi:hypothetical protein
MDFGGKPWAVSRLNKGPARYTIHGGVCKSYRGW